jgi:replication factor C large subunit
MLEIARQTMAAVKKWLSNWKPGKALLLHGPPGTGKTLTARTLAAQHALELIEIDAADTRGATSLAAILRPSVRTKALLKSGKLILIDNVDAVEDAAAIAEIVKAVSTSTFPFILTAGNPYSRKLLALRGCCELLAVKPVSAFDIERLLLQMCKRTGLDVSRRLVKQIAVAAKGDLRAAMLDLTALTAGHREQEKSAFELLRIIFKGNIRAARRELDNSDRPLEEIMWWIEANIELEHKSPEQLAAAFELLSAADIFRARLLSDRAADMVAAISTIKTSKFTFYRPPDRLAHLSKSKQDRRELDSLCGRLAKVLHCSKKRVRAQLPYLMTILKAS